MTAATRVLIVDDDLAARLRLRDLLERESGYEVVEAVDGYAAVEMIAQSLPDLILLDVMMPGMSGLDVCAQLRQQPRTREVPIIVLSAADESESMIAALDAGADDFLRKPFWAPELRAKVRNVARFNRYRALVQERDRFRWLLDRSQEPIVIADDSGAVTYANTEAKKLFGLNEVLSVDVAEMIGRHFRAEPETAISEWRQRAVDGGKFVIVQAETEHVGARWYEVEVQGLENRGEALVKFTNCSGWVRRDLETFTFQHLIAHKIRTPLNGLGPVLQFIEAMHAESASAELQDLLRLAHGSAKRLEDTLCSVLRYHGAVFSAAPTGGVEKREPLAEVLTRAAQTVELTNVTTEGTDHSITHPEMMEIVMIELLDNYAKFSRAKTDGLKIVCTTPDATGCEIRITAPGPDLPPDVVARLGRPYWQPERSFTGEVPGIGLGLATVRELLRWRGGDLKLERNEQIGGLESRLVLPPGCVA